MASEDGRMSAEEYRDEYERVTGEPAPNWLREHIAVSQGMPVPGEVPPFVFCGYGSRAQADAFVEWCRVHGVDRHVVVPSGGHPYRLTRGKQ